MSNRIRILLMVALMFSACGLAGCNMMGWVAQGFAGGEGGAMDVKAEYSGLANKSVAVLVDAGDEVLYQHQLAGFEIAAGITNLLAANVPGVTVMDAKDVADFQQRDIYWNTIRASMLAKRLKVDRLVIVALTEYRTHEPGNTNLYRGVVAGQISVYETDNKRPDDKVYYNEARIAYPPNNSVGVPGADEQAIRKGMVDMFTRSVGGRFYEHKESR